ncbi:MAG TPA: HPr family phosphocarrier protein [Planctomycetota bacterium]|nr:HPr family phosphocarrier protein [Planctomycetota bacterium]
MRRASKNGSTEAERSVRLCNPYGLHARTSAALSQVAGRFRAEVQVAVESWGEEGKSGAPGDVEPVDAKSIISLLTLGATQGSVLRVRAVGDDALQALEAIVELIESGFNGADDDSTRNASSAPCVD